MKTKQELRRHYQALRNALSPDEQKQKSRQIAEVYMSLFEQEKPKAVHLFLPIVAKAEINTFFILERLNTEYPNVKTLTSIVAEDQQTLLTIEVRADMPLVTNTWGIPEPLLRIPFPEQDIEEVLTPLLAMDQEGYRLGYGKGFYDRFFATCSSSVKRTGLNYFSMLKETLPRDEWDEPLHRLVTDSGQWVVNSKQ